MMRRIMFLVLLGLPVLPSAVDAYSAGRLALYSDAGLSECTLTDASPSIADVYVVHRIAGTPAAAGVTGVLFALASSAGFTGTWLEDIVPPGRYPKGTSQSGIGVGYGLSCAFGDLLVLQVRYQMHGTSSSCSFVESVPSPGFPDIITTTCGEGDFLPVDGSRLMVNPNASCPCEVPLATKPSTWGRIKAMYRD